MKNGFSLASIEHHGHSVAVIEVAGQYWLLSEVGDRQLRSNLQRGLVDLFGAWDRNFDALCDVAARIETLGDPVATEASGIRFLTPLQYPNKVLCTGTNYYDHLRAVGRADFNKSDNFPAFFLKAPTTCLVGPGKTVRYPIESKQFDWEIELTAIFGKRSKRVPVEEALSSVAAYTIGLDMSTRDMQRNPKHFAKMDLCLGKSFDDSCPLGPKVVPAAFVENPQDLSLQLWVNGKIEQDSNTRHMIWSTAEQIAEISKHMTIEPGDVLLTGTPAGTGIEQERYLSVGDRIDAEIGGLGRLSVEVVTG